MRELDDGEINYILNTSRKIGQIYRHLGEREEMGEYKGWQGNLRGIRKEINDKTEEFEKVLKSIFKNRDGGK